MALSLATGSAQTSNGASLTPLYLPTASYPVRVDGVGETILRNTSGALDQPNDVRFAVQKVPNMFQKSGITPISDQEIQGLSMLVQLTETWAVNDAADELPTLYYPASAHMVIKVPRDPLVTSTVVANLVLRLIGAVLRDADDTLVAQWNNMLHEITKF